MRYIYAICICLISCKTIFASIRLSDAPLSCCYSNKMEQSFKDNSQFVVNRVRFSTCTGVGWFPSGFKLLSANLLASSFQRYAFDSKSLSCVLERFPNDQQKTKLAWPENLTFSKDGNFLAVSNSSNGKVNIYKVNKKTSKIDAIPIAFVGAFGDVGIHGVRFSPDGNYLGYVTYDPLGKIRFFRISKNRDGTLSFFLSQTEENALEPMAPKGLDFSSDGSYVAICYGNRASSCMSEASGALIVYKFDKEKGEMDPNPISQIGISDGLFVPEDLCFYPDDSCILVSNQGNDTITLHDFDYKTGEIKNSCLGLKNPEACLSFPHGLSISPDGKYLAVSNYGDNKITIYEVVKR